MAIEYLSEEAIESAAQEFLGEYHSVMTLPIPIEEIVEKQLNLDIVPTPGLYHTADTWGWVSSDLTTIYVDEDQFTKYHNRYRFTLAHEVAHVMLHREFYSDHQFTCTEGWKAFTLDIEEEDQRKLEFQANSFAGRILVPTGPLTAMYDESVNKIRKLTKNKLPNSALSQWVSKDLHKSFAVSQQCIEIRIDRQFFLT